MKLSAFSFVHNAIAGGYPIREAILAVAPYTDDIVIVDMQSNDGTRQLLESLGVRILDGKWIPGGGDHACLDLAYAMQTECKYDTIIHFEADEVYSKELIREISSLLRNFAVYDIHVYRLQVEQNFQRIRQYPLLVHRVFRKGSTIGKRMGHTTDANMGWIVSGKFGFLWDCCNCFRDNWFTRVEQNTELHGGNPRYLMTSLHSTYPVELTREQAVEFLQSPHWTWEHTPLAIPNNLKHLVGVTKYE